MGVRVKRPGEHMVGEDAELILTERTPNLRPLYRRLLDDVTPVCLYQPGTWGPDEAQALIGLDGPWRNPLPALEATR